MINRLFDIIFSITALLLLSPFFLVIPIFIMITDGKPIFFSQKRSGINKQAFKFYKFKTMTNKKDKNGDLLPDEKRLSKYGKILRKTSIDELPSLWNVLKGDMSLVGPRPLLMEYLPLYSKEQMRRHEVKPGITGWAQINGRNAISWEEKFELDIWYVKNQSFRLDLRILLLTIWKVLKREGITHGSGETMPKYKGTKNG